MFESDTMHTGCSSALGYMPFVPTEVIPVAFARTFLCLDSLKISSKNEFSLSVGRASPWHCCLSCGQGAGWLAVVGMPVVLRRS